MLSFNIIFCSLVEMWAESHLICQLTVSLHSFPQQLDLHFPLKHTHSECYLYVNVLSSRLSLVRVTHREGGVIKGLHKSQRLIGRGADVVCASSPEHSE